MFLRVGEGTDVVGKEMYAFEDRDGTTVALRPETTASVVRAFLEHHPLTPWKVWYVSDHFRHEKPQKGRLRQHSQFGVEVIGSADPDVDVEVIVGLWDALVVHRAATQPAAAELDGRAHRRASPTRRNCGPGSVRGPTSMDPRDRDRIETQPDPGPRLEEPAHDRGLRRASHVRRSAGAADERAHFDRVQDGLRAAGVPVRDRTPARAWPRLLHPHRVRDRQRRDRRRRSRPSAAAGATTGWSRRWAASPRRASASGRASSGCCSPATPRVSSTAPAAASDCFVVDLRGRRHRRPRPGARAPPRRPRRRPGGRRALAPSPR